MSRCVGVYALMFKKMLGWVSGGLQKFLYINNECCFKCIPVCLFADDITSKLNSLINS